MRDIPDFPRPGVVFKDLTPLFGDAGAFGATISALCDPFAGAAEVEVVLGVEARGFIVAAPVARQLGVGFVPVRKSGKLPWDIESQSYELEYGTDLLEVHRDAVQPDQRVLIVDDVLATGGTAAATARLVERLGAETVGFAFVVELDFLGGREALGDRPVTSLIHYG